MKARKRPLRISVWAAAGVVALLGILALGILALQTDPARSYLSRWINAQLGPDISVQDIHGFLPFDIRLRSLSLSQHGSKWLEIEQARLNWNPWPLLSGRLAILDLEAGQITLHRLPDPGEPDPEARPASLPSWLPRTSVKRLALSRIILPRSMLREAAVFSLRGRGAFDPSSHEIRTALRLRQVDIDRQGLQADLSLRSDLEHLEVDLSAKEPRGGFWASRLGLSLQAPWSLDLTGRGPLKAWEGELALHLDNRPLWQTELGLGLRDPGLKLQAKGQAHLAAASALPGLQGLPQSLTAQPLELGFSLGLNREQSLLRMDSFALSAPSCSLQLSGRLDLGEETLQAQAQMSAIDLQAWQSLAPFPLQGRAELAADISGPLTLPQVKLQLSLPEAELAGTKLQGVQADLTAQPQPAVQDKPASLSLIGKGGCEAIAPTAASSPLGPFSWSWDMEAAANGSLQIKDLNIDLDSLAGGQTELAASGDIQLNSRAFNLNWNLSGPRLSELPGTGPMKGLLQAKGKVQGAFARFTAQSSLSIQGLAGGGLLPSRLGVEIQADQLPQAPQGNLSWSLERQETALQGEARFSALPDSLSLDRIAIRAPGLNGQGQLSWQPESRTFAADWDMQAEDLEWLQSFVRTRTSGRLSAAATLQGSIHQPFGRTSLELEGLETPWFAAAKAQAKARFQDLSQLAGSLSFTGSGIKRNDFAVDQVSIQAKGEQSQARFSLQAKGKAEQAFIVDTSGRMRHTPGETQVLLPTGELSFGVLKAAWSQPISVLRENQKLSLAAPKVSLGGGRAQASLQWTKDSLQGSLSLADFNLKHLPLPSLPALDGRADAELEVSRSPEEPVIEIRTKMSELRALQPDIADIPAFTLAMQGRCQQGTAHLTLDMQSKEMSPVHAELQLPLSVSFAPWQFELGRDILQGSVEAGLNLDRIFAAFPVDAHRFGGQIKASLKLSGRLEDPSITGELDLNNGVYENLSTGTTVSDLTLECAFLGRRMAIRTLKATDGRKGSLSGQGQLVFENLKDPSFDCLLKLDKAELVSLDFFSGQTSGEIRLQSRGERLSLSGELSLFPVELRMPQAKPKGMEGLSVVELDQTGAEKKPPGPAAAAPPPLAKRIDLDLRVRIPGGCFVRGRGLDSEWKGNLLIQGTAASPQINGSMELIQGRLDFLGKRLRLEEGRITFLNEYPPQPVLDLRAATEAKDIKVILQVQGPVTDMDLTFNSEPPYPRDEILSRFLFNRELSAITPVQAVKLALAIRTLTGSGQPGLMDKLRQSLQIDVLELESGQSEGSGPVVGVGKYLNENIFFKVEKGVEAETGRVTVEVDITPNVSVETRAGSVTQSLEVKWKYSY